MGEVMPMPVPASYNDVTTERYVRDHVGIVYYDRTFYVPANWDAGSSRVWLRFGSVHYAAKVVSTSPSCLGTGPGPPGA